MSEARQLIIAAVQRLKAAGVGDPDRDAMLLLGHAAGGTYHRFDPIPPDVAQRFEALIARRALREPVAKIIGRRAFWNAEFLVTPDVLDPRPETESLVQVALEVPFERVLDLGTGSGCILLSLLMERAGASGLGTDASAAALNVARENAARTGLGDRAAFLKSDWFAGVAGQFDLIVSNPPYIAADEMDALAPEVRDHDPQMALCPGGDGLDAYRAIYKGAAAHLLPGGWLMVEIGPTQSAVVSALFHRAGLAGIATRCDLDGRDRVVIGQKNA